jgi:serine/threonine-protein kinase
MDLQAGLVVLDRYRLLRKIGEGAHGVVFAARDLEGGTPVAIKFLNDDLGDEYRTRLEREAVALGRLRGTAATYIHAFGVMQQTLGRRPRTYIVMELLEGKDFERYLGDAEDIGGRLKANKLHQVLAPVVETLHVAHGMGIVHRDLKPSNIFIVDRERGGGVRLLDFGLVKMLDESTLTAMGTAAGTPSYMAPETWKGDPRILDHRIDVYAIGVIVFRALGGQVPFRDSNLLRMREWALGGERPSLKALRPKLPDAIDAWVRSSLAIEPTERFSDVATQWRALSPLISNPAGGPF